MTILTRDSDPWQFEELARRLDGESVSASCGRGSESSFHQWLCVYNLEKSRDGRLFGLWVSNYGDPDNVIG
jgi:hypothetical protein